MSSDTAIRRAFAALAVLSLIWGYNWVVMKQVMQYVDPFDFTAIRTLLGAATLFVVLAQGAELDDGLRARIVDRIRRQVSPRHVPDTIVEAPEVPRTLTGKKMELPVRKLLLGAVPDQVASADAMANPDSLDFYVRYAKTATLTA